MLHFELETALSYDDLVGLEIQNAVFETSYNLGKVAAVAGLGILIDKLQALMEGFIEDGITSYKDINNRTIIYDGKDDNLDSTIDLYSLTNLIKYPSGVNVFGGGGNDWINGTYSSDELNGGAGDDVLSGGVGDDILSGDSGRDALFGGYGYDTYRISQLTSSIGFDSILDEDGQGQVVINGVKIGASGLSWIKDNVWEDSSGLYMVVKFGNDLYITTKSETSAQVVTYIRGWTQGQLDIVLGEKPTTPVVAITHTGTAESDYLDPGVTAASATAAAFDFASNARSVTDADIANDLQAAAASNPGIHAVGNAGRDMLWGQEGGADDVLEGGDGDDIINGNLGKDQLFGDAGNDYISGMGDESTAHGGDGNDVLTAAELGGLRIRAASSYLADTSTIWKDLQQYFTAHIADAQNPFRLLEGGEMVVDTDFSQLGTFNYSGTSVNGRAYRFYSTPNGVHGFELEYLNDSGQYQSALSLGVISAGSLTYGVYQQGVSLYGDAGNDVINGSTADDYLDGGSDDDLIAAGEGDDIVVGGSGNDQVHGGSGNDLISGDAGNDMLFGDKGADIIDGGDGNDVIQGDNIVDGALGGADAIDGGAGDDQLFGMTGDDVINGGSGDDIIHGDADDLDESLHGSDTIDAGDGNDTVKGGAGNDFIRGGAGLDQLFGGKGDDALFGGEGDDSISGDAGNDTIVGAAGNDAMNGGEGDDLYSFDAGWGQDTIFGLNGANAGADIITFGVTVDPASLRIGVNLSGGLVLLDQANNSSLTLDGVLNSGGPNHRIEFADGTVWTLDTLRQQYAAINNGQGTSGADTIVGDVGSNAINGDLGDDTIYGGAGNDSLLGGMDSTYSGTASDKDTLYGGDGDDIVDGQLGDDTLFGGTGNDAIKGGEGSDALYGDSGNDVLDASYYTYTGDNFIQETADDLLVGGEGDDELTGGLGRNSYVFDAGFGHDRLHLTEVVGYMAVHGAPSETAVLRFRSGISAASVNVALVGADLVITSGTDTLTIVDYNIREGSSIELQFDDGSSLSAAQATLITTRQGGPRGENMAGGGLNDTFNANGGDDTLRGGAGNDLFVGGGGTDTIYGGAGDDTFRYGLGDGRDYIYGGTADLAGNDTLELIDGIGLNDITLYKTAWSLFVVINATGNYIQANWIAGEADRGIDVIRFADGSTLTTALIDAMSLPAPPQLEFYASTSGGTVTGNALSNDFFAVYSGGVEPTFVGGKGDDRYFIDEGDTNGTIIENADEGSDTVYTSRTYYEMAANVENLIARQGTWIYPTPRTFIGNALNNVIDVSGGGEYSSGYRLDGGAGTDVLIGGVSNDTYVVDSLSDQIIESARNTSIDTVEASLSYTIADRIELENITLTGAAATSATGNRVDNRLDGSKSSGANILTGGQGNDTYVLGAGDVVVEAAGEGTDTAIFETGVIGAFTTSGYANIERYQLGASVYDSSLTGGSGNDDLSGNLSDNVLVGGDGDDTLRDRTTFANYDDNDQLYGGNGNDTLISVRGNDLLVGGKGDDTLQGNTATFVYARGDGHDTIVGTGTAGTASLRFDSTVVPSDIQFTRDGTSLVITVGTGGTDGIVIQNYWDVSDAIVSPVKFIEFQNASGDLVESWTSAAVIGRLYAVTLTGGAGDDNLVGGVGYDTLTGNAGNDRLEGGAGNDTIDGGTGNDTYVFDGNFGVDRVLGLDATTGGIDTIQFGTIYNTANVSWSVNDNDDLIMSAFNNGVSNEVTLVGFMRSGAPAHQITLGDGTILTSASIRAQSLAATADADYIYGFGSDDTINGLAGDDYLYGRGGNDTLRGGDGVDNVFGGTGNDHLYGDAGDDVLAGEEGSDILEGGLGNDTYYVSDTLETIIEAASAGTDVVYASVDHALAANVENLYLVNGVLRGTGNSLANRIEGNDLDNILDGGAGNDTLVGGLGNDTYIVDSATDVVTELAGGGIDTIQSSVTLTTLAANVENLTLIGNLAINGTGNSLANTLTGNSAANTLNGGAGIDTMAGGAGNDIYVVDATGDVVVEQANEGTDTVQASATCTLSANVENLTLTGTTAISGTGNSLNNVLAGNSAANTLSGGAGNDTLNGGAGNDTMIGGTGDDSYTVDSTSDVITELAGEGNDQVSASVTYTLSANVEKLTLTGTTAINGTGNAGDNVLIGNSANNTLTGGAGNDIIDGGTGNDTMVGGTGDDTYFVNVSTDVVTESSNEGTDTVNAAITYSIASAANIENITLTGTTAINATGNNAANVLIGNSNTNAISAGAGNDTLDGGAGADTLTGGTGNDTYQMARGYGVDTVVENDATAGNYDVAKFLTGIAFDQLWFSRPSGSNNLEITIIGTSDKMVVKDWYLGAQYRTEEIQVTDGNRYLLAADVQTLVTAMASQTPPALGQTTLSASQRTALNTALTSAWKTRTSMVTNSLPAEVAPGTDQLQNAWLPGTTATSPDVLHRSHEQSRHNRHHEPDSLWSLLHDARGGRDTHWSMTTGGNAIAQQAAGPGPGANLWPSPGALPPGVLPPGVLDWDMQPGFTDCGIALVRPDCGKTPTLPDCGKPATNHAVTLSTCNRLVDLMAMSDGNERDLAFVSFRGRDRNDHWTP